MIYNTEIIGNTKVAEGTYEVYFQRPKNFNFTAGQYIQTAVPSLTYPDSKGSSRVFSLTSSPNDTEKLSVVFRDSGSGFKKTLLALQKGDTISIEGPMGHFVYPNGLSTPQVYIAGGVGIAPFLSMLEHHIAQNFTSPITLIYANKDAAHSAHLVRLRQYAQTHQWFTLQEEYTMLSSDTFPSYLSANPEVLWFLVGPPPMVTHTHALLKNYGVSDKNIRTESFTGY